MDKDGQSWVYACFTKVFMSLLQCHCRFIYNNPIDYPGHCHSKTFTQIHTSKDFYKYSFYPLAIVKWNALSQHNVCLPTIDSFKEAVGRLQRSRPYIKCCCFNLILSHQTILTYNLLCFSLTSFICSYFC